MPPRNWEPLLVEALGHSEHALDIESDLGLCHVCVSRSLGLVASEYLSTRSQCRLQAFDQGSLWFYQLIPRIVTA
jgi:hypothetical protein